MLPKSGLDALKALLELAIHPGEWRSSQDLAAAQGLAAPMMEQLLLRLRRSGLIEARRGRLGGYRLARSAREIPIAAVLAAAHSHRQGPPAPEPLGSKGPSADEVSAASLVTQALERRLQRTMARALEQVSLEDLLFDWHSAKASQNADGGLLIG